MCLVCRIGGVVFPRFFAARLLRHAAAVGHATNQNGDARPARIGDGYEVVETFGTNAAGVVYAVRHAGVDRPLALTILGAEIAGDRERLGRIEVAVRDVSALTHEHIARVVEFEREADPPHVVEAVLGAPLARVLPDRGPRRALEVARRRAGAFAQAHGAGLVHGALAPGTVWIGPDRPRRAVLSGFASAAAGVVDVRYVAPERLARGVVDARGDVFALGLVL